MQRNKSVGARHNARSLTTRNFSATKSTKSPLSRQPISADGDDDVTAVASQARGAGYCDDSGAKLNNQMEEEFLVDAVHRLRLAKSRATADRNTKAMMIRRDFLHLESQRKAAMRGSSTEDLGRSSRKKNTSVQSENSGSATSSPDFNKPRRISSSSSISNPQHTKLTRWRFGNPEQLETTDSELDIKDSYINTDRPTDELNVNRQPFQKFSGSTPPSRESEKDAELHNKFVRFSDRAEILTDDGFHSHRPRSQSVGLPHIKVTHTVIDDNHNRIPPTVENPRKRLLEKRAKTASPSLSGSPAQSDDTEIDDMRAAENVAVEELRIASAPSSPRRARSHSFSYLTLGQSKVSFSGKVRAVKDRTISLHGRTSRELRTMTNIDNIAAAAAERERREMEEKKRGLVEQERRALQARVDDFLGRLREGKQKHANNSSSSSRLAVTI